MSDESSDDLGPIQHSVQNQIAMLMEDSDLDSVNPGSGPQDTFAMTTVKDGRVPQASRPITDTVDDEITYTHEDLEQAIIAFQKEKKLPPLTMKGAILDHARLRSLDYIIVEDYDAAERMDRVIDDLYRAFSGDLGVSEAQARERDFASRIEAVKQQQTRCKEDMERRIQSLKEREQEKINELHQSQEQEKQEFFAVCQEREFLSRFSKPSKELLQLRKVQRELALAHDFDGAKQAKKSAEELQQLETLEAQKRAMESVKLNYQQLVERHEREMHCHVENSRRKIATMEAEMEKMDDANQKLLRQPEGKLKGIKVKKCVYSPENSRSGKIPTTATRKELQYRSAKETQPLDIKVDMTVALAKAKRGRR